MNKWFPPGSCLPIQSLHRGVDALVMVVAFYMSGPAEDVTLESEGQSITQNSRSLAVPAVPESPPVAPKMIFI